MKLCQVMASDSEGGGLEKHVIELCDGLATRHDVHAIADPRFASDFSNVTFHPLDMRWSRHNPALLLKIWRILKRMSPDIVHAHANKACRLAARVKPFLHDNIHFVGSIHSLKRDLSDFEKMDFVVGVSHKILEKLDNPNRKAILNGLKLDTARLTNRDYLSKYVDIGAGDLAVIGIGRLVRAKRFDVLIRAFAGTKDTCLLIVGSGPEEMALKNLVRKLDLKNVHFLGHRADNIELLCAADLCVISSEREGFPYVLTESLRVGTPVLSTAISDVRRILPSEYAVDVDDVEALHRALNAAVKNRAKLSDDYQDVFKWAEKQLSFDYMLNEVEQIYEMFA